MSESLAVLEGDAAKVVEHPIFYVVFCSDGKTEPDIFMNRSDALEYANYRNCTCSVSRYMVTERKLRV